MQPRAVLDPLVGVVIACVCAGDRVFRGVGGKCAGVLAGNVLQGEGFVEVGEFCKWLSSVATWWTNRCLGFHFSKVGLPANGGHVVELPHS